MSYKGLVAEIPLALDGLVGVKNLTEVLPTQLIATEAIAFTEGTITKEGGTLEYTSGTPFSTDKIIALHDWWPTEALQRIIAVDSAGNMKKDSGSGSFSTTLKTGLSTSALEGVFVEGGAESISANRKLFYFNGSNAVQVLSGDGATTSDIATPAADWATTKPRTGCLHEGRLWGFTAQRAYYSTLTNHEDFTGAGSGTMPVYPGEGEAIEAAVSFKGLLLVFKKPRGIYLIDTSDPDATKWRVKPLTRAVGIAGPNAWAMIDNDVAFMHEEGSVHLVSAVQEFGDMQASSLSDRMILAPFLRDNINEINIRSARAVYYYTKRELHFAVPGITSSVNNRRLVFDLTLWPDKPRARWSERDTCVSLALRKDSQGVERPIFGDDAGNIFLMDQTAKEENGAAYLGMFQTAHLDFGHLDPSLKSKRKNYEFLELIVEPTGNWSINVDVYLDGRFSQAIDFNLGVLGEVLGTFTLDVDQLGGGSVLNRRKRLLGSGRRISFVVKNAGLGQDFSIAKMLVYFTPGDEREQRT